MTNLEKARQWLEDNGVPNVGLRDVTLAALLDEVCAEVASRRDTWRKVAAAERTDIFVEPVCTGTLVHDEFTRCPKHDR